PKAVWVRIHGKVVFDNDINIKSEIIESSSLVKSIYQTPDNSAFEIFYLEEAEAVFYDFSGNPPKKYSL
ncbi:MAG: pyridoxamine 5'-phosphate oxidase, partial [Fusobacterium sp.]|nr:pyridoxamine 5'-phosphate oxidase [Fusobacterium sp.]